MGRRLVTGRLLTARALADMLDVTPATVLRWSRRGDLPALRLPSGQIRYRPAEIDAWLAYRSVPAEVSDGLIRPGNASQTHS